MALAEKSEEDEEEEQQPNVSHLLRQEANATFMECNNQYAQVEWLLPKNYTQKQATLSLLSLVASGAEECAVSYQMNGTVDHLILYIYAARNF